MCNLSWTPHSSLEKEIHVGEHRPLSRRLDRCDRVIQDEVGDSNGGRLFFPGSTPG